MHRPSRRVAFVSLDVVRSIHRRTAGTNESRRATGMIHNNDIMNAVRASMSAITPKNSVSPT